jgi:hypothetical protein
MLEGGQFQFKNFTTKEIQEFQEIHEIQEF